MLHFYAMLCYAIVSKCSKEHIREQTKVLTVLYKVWTQEGGVSPTAFMSCLQASLHVAKRWFNGLVTYTIVNVPNNS